MIAQLSCALLAGVWLLIIAFGGFVVADWVEEKPV